MKLKKVRGTCKEEGPSIEEALVSTWDDAIEREREGDEMRNGTGRSNTGICSASIPRFVQIRKAVDRYQNIRHKGYKGWDPQRLQPNAVFPRRARP